MLPQHDGDDSAQADLPTCASSHNPVVPEGHAWNVPMERNLAALGFFSSSSKRVRTVDRKRVPSRLQDRTAPVAGVLTEILPSLEYGLPCTADLDKFLALQEIIERRRAREGQIRNPVTFTSAEILRILGKRVSAGKNYDDVGDWLQRMAHTAIQAENSVYLASSGDWTTGTLHVFAQVVPFGSALEDGTIAGKNHVWLADWLLTNINRNYQVPVDLDRYRRLENHIAKALVPLLELWLSAELQCERFECRYEDLCQILGVRRYHHLSKIREKLSKSLNELQTHGYLNGWEIARDPESSDYLIVFRREHPAAAAQAAGAG